jgi:O-antigen/teichoic acid export membrane protein
MLVANVLQRGIGFARNLAICHFLSQQQLGMWALASSFFVIGAPMAVLGLPGTFGRFAETYRNCGQLKQFVVTLMGVSLCGLLAMSLVMMAMPIASSSFIFGSPQDIATMLALCIALGCIALFNAGTELMNGLRRSKIVSSMHTVNSLALTATGLTALLVWPDWRAMVLAFAASALIGLIPSLPVFLDRSHWTTSPNMSFSQSKMWGRIAPYAANIWFFNAITNTFDIVDRMMLLHWGAATQTSDAGQSLIGQLHSGKLLPALLASVSLMFSGILLPYLVRDWESNRRDRVVQFLRSSISVGTILFVGASIGAMLVAPTLFQWLFANKYSEGLGVMPLALIAVCWMAVALNLHNYFWCAERGRVLALIALGSLAVNLIANALLIPSMGLRGALTGTMLATGFDLFGTILVMRTLGADVKPSSFLILLLPLTLAGGLLPATLAWSGVVIACSRTDWVLTADEKRLLDTVFLPILNKAGVRLQSIWQTL